MVYTCPRAQKKHLILTLALFVIVGYEQSNYKVVMVVNDYNCTFHQQTNNKVIMIMIDYNRTYYLESCRLLSVFSDVDRQLCSQALGVSLHQNRSLVFSYLMLLNSHIPCFCTLNLMSMRTHFNNVSTSTWGY